MAQEHFVLCRPTESGISNNKNQRAFLKFHQCQHNRTRMLEEKKTRNKKKQTNTEENGETGATCGLSFDF
ncbi:hypothetical protein OAG29_02240 [Planctomycetaceae bacterium]|nr:hypothetical protein [Planctomycetaceae bacterium]